MQVGRVGEDDASVPLEENVKLCEELLWTRMCACLHGLDFNRVNFAEAAEDGWKKLESFFLDLSQFLSLNYLQCWNAMSYSWVTRTHL